ncbi:MAG TPA: gamma carbonic anhydrase family protein [Spongiibacteraceae bacterium]|nr:gamma carbonic anhydrase family protein [Spongiibacteraceae bacterium]HCS29118.1 gamma carbonic anhydrase family protein [Spongiibacteraceae bacterium]|tara:strand:- start:669 stop:1193 length:525 start_codon:yes stop_codon:yes gene_type:complete
MIFSLDDLQVTRHGDDQFIAHNATVIGNVTLSELVSIWFNVVVRGDAEKISIGARSNIQDASVLHADPGFPLQIGEDVTVGHKAMLHGCTIGDGSLIGINAVVLNGAKIGKGCLIGANALVTEGTEIPDGSMVLGSPAKIKRALSDDEQAALKMSAAHYVENGQRFRRGLKAEP